MNRDDLLHLLDLKGRQPPEHPGKDLVVLPEARAVPADLSPTALKLDDWALRRGVDLLAESPRLQKTQLDALAVADFHGVAFELEPVLLEDCQDQPRRAFLEQLLQTPAYRALHAATRLDPVSAGIAATAFAEQFAALRQQGERDAGTEGSTKEDLDHEMATLRAVGKAVTEAGKEVEECQQAIAALGLGPGCPGSNDPGAIAQLYRRVRGSPTLRRISDAGRSLSPAGSVPTTTENPAWSG